MLAKWLPKDKILKNTHADKTSSSGGKIKTVNARIDRAAGVVNSANSEELYRQLLAEFTVSHCGDVQEIKDALEKGEGKTAHRLAHTLKSTANLIGAKSLGNAALAVEAALKEKGDEAGKTEKTITQDMWKTLDTEFSAVLAELEAEKPETNKQSEPVRSAKPQSAQDPLLDKARALALIEKLETMLKTGSTNSLNMISNIREILGAMDECEKLTGYITNFDFTEAAAVLDKIKEKLA
jgi:HPt (histidine-containing phosphotransfer) domain-containing protein